MIIGVDGNEANVENRVGVSVYTLHLLEYFRSQASNTLQFRIMMRDNPRLDLPPENQYFQYEMVRPSLLWSQVGLPIRLMRESTMDVFFSPAHYAPRFSPIPTVVTIHDLAYFHYPDEFLKKDLHKLKNWTKYSVHAARKVIAVSQQTKRDVIKYYNVPESKISVIYNGFGSGSDSHGEVIASAKSKSTHNERNEKNKKDDPFILYVGTIQPRKNIITLIKAFEMFHTKHNEFRLKIVGKKGWKFDKTISAIEASPAREYIDCMGFVSDNKLSQLYAQGFCFVLPSLYEGFGIPVLEAMSFGCPTIISNTSSLPEVGGDASLYFSPDSVNELVEKLEELYASSSIRTSLIKKGHEQVKKFSWERCASETLDTLVQISKRTR